MKKYKSKFQEYFKQILSYKNYKIFDVEHSIERYNERIPIYNIRAHINHLHYDGEYCQASGYT